LQQFLIPYSKEFPITIMVKPACQSDPKNLVFPPLPDWIDVNYNLEFQSMEISKP